MTVWFAAVIFSAAIATATWHPNSDSIFATGDYGSYVATCNGTNVIFQNYKQQNCQGASAWYSSPLDKCAIEYIPQLKQNFSWNAFCNATNAWYNNFGDTTCAGSSLLSRYYVVGQCFNCPNPECKNGPMPPNPPPATTLIPTTTAAPGPQGPIFSLLENMPWLENQWHTQPGEVFIGSMNSGTFFRVRYDPNTCTSRETCNATVQSFVGGFQSAAGVAYGNQTIFGLAVSYGQEWRNSLIRFSPAHAHIPVTVATAPSADNLFGNFTLNGLALHAKTGKFYATSLGNFTSGNGAVYEIDPATGSFTAIATKMNVPDGAFIFADKLYVSDVFTATIHVFDLNQNGKQINSYSAPGMKSLDDFFVDIINGTVTLVGADWAVGNIVSFAADGSSKAFVIHATGLLHPTSVRPELDANGRWNTDFVTVTEGGLFPAGSRGANHARFFRLHIHRGKTPGDGALIQLSCPNSTCNGGCQSAEFPLNTCMPYVNSTGIVVECSSTTVWFLEYADQTCSGSPTISSLSAEQCLANENGDGYFVDFCRKSSTSQRRHYTRRGVKRDVNHHGPRFLRRY